ncbi:MAG: DNA repair protein RecO [Gemmatimonadales bacterium]|nr:DNA repair protein RecO [Gemmatimonadales bacterium]NIN12824.1 DNA repair protein RecO [Gemmatimonadales bacterium]NIN48752.1 DNA repair protein RecO [Gemmatimonadales bacterium]NIP06216.1 DNA repair protein RecO [Gemmatimonadales bacterium]NIR01401.1 DNA repair protein RecO [Gemmatimonadales bacterium]
MPPVSTPAVVLHAFPYGETSKIVRLLTLEHGVQSAIAKGARRPNSKFGACLQLLSEGTAQLYLKPTRELQTLAEFDVIVQRPELARDVDRYAAGAALAELVMRFSPAEPHPEIYQLVVAELDHLATVAKEELDAAALGALWGTVCALGFAPNIGVCARDGAELPGGTVAFSVADGGFLCRRCARGTATSKLTASDRQVLERLITGRRAEIGSLSPRHAAAHRRLLARFVERHVADGRELRALDFWQGHS